MQRHLMERATPFGMPSRTPVSQAATPAPERTVPSASVHVQAIFPNNTR